MGRLGREVGLVDLMGIRSSIEVAPSFILPISRGQVMWNGPESHLVDMCNVLFSDTSLS